MSSDYLASYVAAGLAQRLGSAAKAGGAISDRFPGAVLFADISRFSALADLLAERMGSDGADELTRFLNACFGFMVDRVAAFGGEITDVSGDAILAIWPTDERGWSAVAEVVRAAAGCALSLLEGIRVFRRPDETDLGLRVSLSAGEVFAARVGGVKNRWEVVTAGSALRQAMTAFERSSENSCVVSPEGWGWIADRARGVPVGGGYYTLTAIESTPADEALQRTQSANVTDEHLRLLVPHIISAAASADLPEWVAEVRPLTAMFCDLGDLDYEGPEILATLNAAVRVIQENSYAVGGSLNKVGADDKGTMALVAFGLPPQDDVFAPHHAVEAALRIQAELMALGICVGIGLTTGKAFCGPIGNERRRVFALNGQVVNLAARLVKLRRGSLLCDRETYRAARAYVGFEALPPVSLKGFSTALAVYAVTHHHAAEPARVVPRRTALFGRREEMASSVRHLLATREERPAVLMLEGSSGVGKSRMAAELIERAEELGFPTFTGLARAPFQATPYFPWRAIFQDLLGFGSANGEDEHCALVQNALRRIGLDVTAAPFLNVVTDLSLAENEETRDIAGGVRAERTAAILEALLRAAAHEGPLFVFLEDAHWMDVASWALSLRLVQNRMPIRLLITVRPRSPRIPDQKQRIADRDETRVLPLENLTSGSTVELICATLGVDSVPAHVGDWVHKVSQGNPLHTEELALGLREGGLLPVARGSILHTPSLDDLEGLALPYSVETVVTSRIGQLSVAEQLTLKCASVIGQEFSLAILSGIVPSKIDARTLEDHLQHLAAADLVTIPAVGDGGPARFKHQVTCRVTYDLLPREQRHALHRAVALWYQKTYTHNPAPVLPLLAHHWLSAGRDREAVRCLEQAGENALRAGAHADAAEFFRRALGVDDIAESDAESCLLRSHWEQRLASAEWSLGHLAAAERHARKTFELLGRPLPQTGPGWVFQLATQLAVQLAEVTGIRNSTPSNERGTREAEICAAAAVVLMNTYYFLAVPIPLVTTNVMAIRLAERTKKFDSLGRAWGTLGLIAGVGRLHRLANFCFQKPRAACRTKNDLVGLHDSVGAEAIYHLCFARWDRAETCLTEALRLCRRVGDPQNTEHTLTLIGLSDYFRGRFQSSYECFSEVLESATRRQNDQHRAWGLYATAQNLIRMGRLDRAPSLLAEAFEYLQQHDDKHSQAICDGLRAMAFLYAGDWQRARVVAIEGLSRGEQIAPNNFGSLEGYAGPAEVLCGVCRRIGHVSPHDSDIQASLAERACRNLKRYARLFPIGQPRLWLFRGWYWWNRGVEDRARRSWLRSLEMAERMRMPFDQARAHQALAHDSGLNDADRHMSDAVDLAAQTAAVLYPMGCGVEGTTGSLHGIPKVRIAVVESR